MRPIAILLAVLPSLALAETLAGVASVVDGDTLEIHGERIRLHGIDAPQSTQPCKKLDGSQWRCGQQAALALADRIDRKTVRCEGAERDRYGHLIAVCYHKGQDLSAWMVHQGWALAHRRYGRSYISQEQQAKVSRAGIWSGAFIVPWEWRPRHRGEDATNDKDSPDFGHQGEAGRFTQPR